MTSISINIAQGGVTTNYRMQTWQRTFGKIDQYYQHRLMGLQQAFLENRKNIVDQMKDLRSVPIDIAFRTKGLLDKLIAPRTKSTGSSSNWIVTDILQFSGLNSNDNFSLTNPLTMPAYYLTEQLHPELEDIYINKAGNSMDGFSRPFSAVSSGNNSEIMPHFETPVMSEHPNMFDLHPFSTPHDVAAIVRGKELPEFLAFNTLPV